MIKNKTKLTFSQSFFETADPALQRLKCLSQEYPGKQVGRLY